MRLAIIGPASRAGRVLLDTLLPGRCVNCAAAVVAGEPPLCELCRTRLPRVNHPRCRRCGATRRLELPALEGCPACVEWGPWLARAFAPCRMAGPAERVVHALKYEGVTALAPFMAGQMAGGAAGLVKAKTVILVPVPLSRARCRERGYNQAKLLAQALGRILSWSVEEELVRSHSSRAQAQLGREDRRANVAGAFTLAESAAMADSCAGRAHLCTPRLLVDDVLTTGATAEACAAALLDSGRPCAGAVTFARALPD